jgi:hypothetical protein
MHSDNYMIVNLYALRQLHDCQPICTRATSCMPYGACIRNNYDYIFTTPTMPATSHTPARDQLESCFKKSS